MQNSKNPILDIPQQKPVRAAFIGNIANNFFREVQALRKYSDIDAVLYLHRGPETSNTALPESDDPKLASGYPEWIRVLPELPIFNLVFVLKRLHKSPAFTEFIAELNSYDICIFSSSEVVFIPYLSTTTIYRATGSDLTVFPVLSYQQFLQLRPNHKITLRRQPFKYLRQFMTFYLRRSKYRKALRAASYINASSAKPYQIALKKLGVRENRKIYIFLLTIDTGLFSRDVSKAQRAAVRWGIHDYNFIAFMPSRMMIKNTKVHADTGQWKASEQALHAYKSFLESISKDAKSKVILLIPDRTQSDDLELAKSLIRELEIEDYVMFVQGDSGAGLSRHELIQLYSLSDVVLDDFGAGWYGSVVVEALSCSCPVITHVPKAIMSKFPWHPIQNAKAKEEISEMLRFLYSQPLKKEEIGIQSRRWVEEFHSASTVSDSLANSLKALV